MSTETATERGHHPYSPSSLEAREASPYWSNRSNSTSEAAEAGTKQHDAAEGSVDIDDPVLSDTQAEAVAQCKLYRDRIFAKYPGGTSIKEVYLPVDDEIMVDAAGRKWVGTTGGYLDCAIVSADKTEAEIIDYKFGAWSVSDASTNPQGIAYLLGLYKMFPKLRRCTVHFLMPHREEATMHTFEHSEFQALYTRIVAIVRRAQAATADLRARGDKATEKCNPTTSSCLFCGNLGRCAIAAKFALVIGKKYAPVKVPASIDVTLISSDPAQVKDGLELASLMATWAKAYRAQVTEKAIEDDKFIPEGYKLTSKADRDIVDQALFIKTAIEFGVDPKAIEAVKTLPLTPIGKLIRDTAERGQKELKEKKFSDATIENKSVERGQPYTFLERLRS